MKTVRTVGLLLAALTLAPLTAPASAAGEPLPLSDKPVPLRDLVPGVPLPQEGRYQLDTPDQGAMPLPGDRRPRKTPGAEHAWQSDLLVEYVPKNMAEDGSAQSSSRRCAAGTGPYQSRVERYLNLTPDGRQSQEDCVAIRNFQKKYGIRPASGFAGPVTWRVLRLFWFRNNPHKLRGCPARAGRVACVDLTSQFMWVRQGRRGKVTQLPMLIRTGRDGYETRRGWHRVGWRHKHHWSSLYNSPMPYSQFFSGGQAFHGIYKNVFSPPGSYGCINLRYRDAQRLWKVLHKGDRVFVWGRRPGT